MIIGNDSFDFKEKDNIKSSFANVKQDIDILNFDMSELKKDILEIKQDISKICDILEKISIELKKNSEKIQQNPQIPEINFKVDSTDRRTNPTTPTHIPAHFWSLNPLKPKNKPFSTGNEGVPTDRQTNQQTDSWSKIEEKKVFNQPIITQIPAQRQQNPQIQSPIEDAAKILDSLDTLKKEIRLKFKNLTDQEILVFSTLYQLEEEQGPVEYRVLSDRLGLTESSIRDYIGRLLKKGIPLDKTKINNKQIQISISQNLKKIAPLSTILQLRDI